MSFIDYTEQTLGSIKVLRRNPKNSGSHPTWLCECILCGKERRMTSSNLVGGSQCDCIQKAKYVCASLPKGAYTDKDSTHIYKVLRKENLEL